MAMTGIPLPINDYTHSVELRGALTKMLSDLGSEGVVFSYGHRRFTTPELLVEMNGGTLIASSFIDQMMIAAMTLLRRAKGNDPDEPKGGLTLCACKHASGHHDLQQGGRCLKHRCGCLQFDPKESVDPESEDEEEVRMERDSLVTMYACSQANTTHERRMMMEALGITEGSSHTALLMNVCSELKRLREKENPHV